MIDLGSFKGKNCPTAIMSQSRAGIWRDFAALLMFGNAGFWVWLIWADKF